MLRPNRPVAVAALARLGPPCPALCALRLEEAIFPYYAASGPRGAATHLTRLSQHGAFVVRGLRRGPRRGRWDAVAQLGRCAAHATLGSERETRARWPKLGRGPSAVAPPNEGGRR